MIMVIITEQKAISYKPQITYVKRIIEKMWMLAISMCLLRILK